MLPSMQGDIASHAESDFGTTLTQFPEQSLSGFPFCLAEHETQTCRLQGGFGSRKFAGGRDVDFWRQPMGRGLSRRKLFM